MLFYDVYKDSLVSSHNIFIFKYSVDPIRKVMLEIRSMEVQYGYAI